MIASSALGWRMNLLPVHVDDALYRPDQETLSLGVVLRDDHEGIALIFKCTGTGRHRQIEDRDGRPTNICQADAARHEGPEEFAAVLHQCQVLTVAGCDV